jgi:hypothetical protein
MPIELNNDIRRALGLAVQILEDMPEWLQPLSNMDDMRDLLARESTSRDGAILTEAAATALAWRTLEIVEAPPLEAANAEVHIRRVEEFKALFALVKRIDASHFALRYVEMCDRLARLKKSQKPAG